MFSVSSRPSREPSGRDDGRSSNRDWVKEESKAAAQYAINVLRPKADGTRERAGDRASRLTEKTAPRVSRSDRNPQTADTITITITKHPRTPSPAPRLVNAPTAKTDPTKQRPKQIDTPPTAKARDTNVRQHRYFYVMLCNSICTSGVFSLVVSKVCISSSM